MSGTAMPISDWSAPDPDDLAGPVDPLLDAIFEDAAAVGRGLVEIRRLVEHLQAGLVETA